MQVIADLQLHSKFSRAVSKEMTLLNLALWAKKKGIGLIATGDWTHPKWFMEIERDLEEMGNGLLKIKDQKSNIKNIVPSALVANKDFDPTSVLSLITPSAQSLRESEAGQNPPDGEAGFVRSPQGMISPNPLFLLASEVSCIYTQGGKGRRVHTLIWVPSLESARKINKEMTRQGCNLLSDGRPIIGLTSIQVAELVFTIEPKALVIPAHCLMPTSYILQEDFHSKEIQNIKIGESVLTHTGSFQKVTEVKKRAFSGDVITIQPWYFRPGLTTTPEHPYYAIQTIKKCPSTGDICRPSESHRAICKHKAYLGYSPKWIQAKDLTVGDVLVYPRSVSKKKVSQISLIDDKNKSDVAKITVSAGGSRGRTMDSRLMLTPEFGRLFGYYLAEGSTDGNNSFSFCFSKNEEEYVEDVIALVQAVFHLDHPRIYLRHHAQSIEITFYSKIHAEWFSRIAYTGSVRRAFSKCVPDFLLHAEPIVQGECLRGWYRGDKGYTSSQTLMNQMKAICLMLGIIPSIHIDTVAMHTKRGKHTIGKRIIYATHASYSFTNFAFFSDSLDLKKEIPRSQTKIDRKHGWIDDTHVYLPIKDITISSYDGEVYNLEVEHDHSYVAEFAAVHNCWTPWFAMYGSMSGFDSISDAFGKYADRIFAVETGLSSNPSMNWCIPELDSRTILSFSDAHSLPKLGREATVFEYSGELSDFSYQHIYEAISRQQSVVSQAES
ncbi:hypothetical protein HY947_05765 [Candidatus Gottesmanbacteria bacterium]|nr:hypothetical protein [Candidatus Gottesmanbacteria bacterium]